MGKPLIDRRRGCKIMTKKKIGIIGCGKISGIYMKMCKRLDELELVACSDLVMEKAQASAEEYGIPKVYTVEELLEDPDVQIVLNLTVPAAHSRVSVAAIEAGKNLYNEKPLAINREDGQEMLSMAAVKGLRIGCAPDTFMGGGLQTCRKLIDDGVIGEPIAATAFMACHGHESWHPNPDFYYQPGGGPMFDMGPYYLTALISLMGPVRRVTGSTRITFPERIITSQPQYGTTIKVNTPTHVTGVMDFASGAIGTIITSFDIWGSQLPRIEIYGSEGTLSVPDPNTYGGPVRILLGRNKEWNEVPLTHGYTENSRGIGVADMARAIGTGETHRANGKMAYHVLDIMHAFHDSSLEGKHVELASTCTQPAPLPPGFGL